MNASAAPHASSTQNQACKTRAALPAVGIKQKVAFAMMMGVITTGVISFTLIALNLGFNERFLRTWLRSWGVGYAVAIPAILILSPLVQRAVNALLKSPAAPRAI